MGRDNWIRAEETKSAVEVAKLWQQQQVNIIPGIRNKEGNGSTGTPGWARVMKWEAVQWEREITKDIGTTRSKPGAENVENKHNILSPLAFQFPAGKETMVMWSAESGL